MPTTKLVLGVMLVIGLWLPARAGWQAEAAPQLPAPTLTPTPPQNRMGVIEDMFVAPELPENPRQADYGRQVYYYVCMACHGDQGQGLTPEWVAQWDLEANACWESKCHASNHPPEGFDLPRAIPGVVSPVIRARFDSALELHDYIQATMPWHAPGSLEAEKYWQLTAFLLEINGIDPGAAPLDEARAAQVTWRQPASTPVPAIFAWARSISLGTGAAALTLGAVLLFSLWRLLRRNPPG